VLSFCSRDALAWQPGGSKDAVRAQAGLKHHHTCLRKLPLYFYNNFRRRLHLLRARNEEKKAGEDAVDV